MKLTDEGRAIINDLFNRLDRFAKQREERMTDPIVIPAEDTNRPESFAIIPCDTCAHPWHAHTKGSQGPCTRTDCTCQGWVAADDVPCGRCEHQVEYHLNFVSHNGVNVPSGQCRRCLDNGLLCQGWVLDSEYLEEYVDEDGNGTDAYVHRFEDSPPSGTTPADDGLIHDPEGTGEDWVVKVTGSLDYWQDERFKRWLEDHDIRWDHLLEVTVNTRTREVKVNEYDSDYVRNYEREFEASYIPVGL